jgi:phospholipase/carboxylesterase
MLNINHTIDPHDGQSIIYAGADIEHAESAMIVLHGRGATAESMVGLVSEIYADKMIYVIPQATNFAWYPYRFIEEREVNEPGISSGLTLIQSIVNALVEKGIQHEKIFFLGFSQGACLAADFIARYPSKYGGLFVLSGGLIGDQINSHDYSGDLLNTPVFLGCSDVDFHVPEQRVHESARIFEHLNADVTKKIYPNMGHTINRDEISFVRKVINLEQFAEVTSDI